MATVESETSTGGKSGGDALVYDGFISYSHAADDLLAPRLQSGLQRFAKPWWKRRALRIFRDESSLSANPHLWSSITEALDSSGWFVLLLSPDAADSPWVNQEIEYWKEHKDPSRILPVLTDGTFEWTDSDVSGTAVPEQLQSTFSEEPRWVDMRFARDETDLDLKDPRYADAVADIASALRGIPKDELASEEVKQHRRTIRTAWAAGAMLLLLAVAATGFGIQAVQQRDLAEANEVEARTNAELAALQADRANTEVERANTLAEQEAQAREDAYEQAQLARSQELAAASTSVLESDPELASLLAALSIQRAPGEVPAESVRALRKADRANLLEMRIPHEGFSTIEIAPDGSSVLAFNDSMVTSFELATGTEEWSLPLDDHVDWLISTTLSPDGSLAALTGRNSETGQGKLLVISVPDREIVEVFKEECWNPGWHQSGYPFSPDGSVLAVLTGTSACLDDADQTWVSFRDTSTWQEVGRLQIPGFMEVATFDRDDGHLLVIDMSDEGRRVDVRSYPDLEVITTLDATRTDTATFDRNGDRVAIQARDNTYGIHDVASDQFLGWVEGQGVFTFGAHPIFSPDGTTLFVHSEAGNLLVDSATGKLVTQIGSNEPTVDAEFTPDGRQLVTSGEHKLEIWNLGEGSTAAPLSIGDSQAVWVNPDRVIDGPTAAVHVYEGTFPADMINWLVLIDPQTGATVDAIPTNTAAQLPDGRFVIVDQTILAEARFGDMQREAELGGLSIWDPSANSLTPLTECSLLLSQTDWFTSSPTPLCDNGDPAFSAHGFGGPWIRVSPDGSKIAADSPVVKGEPCSEGLQGRGSRLIRVWDVTSTDVLIDLEVDACETLNGLGDTWLMTDTSVYDLADGSLIAGHAAAAPAYELTANGSHVIGVSGQDSQHVLVLDTQGWSEVARWEGHNARIRGVAVSPDGQRLATTGTDKVVRIWDLAAVLTGGLDEGRPPRLLDEIPTGIASDAYWIDDRTLGVALRDGRWTTVALDPDVVANQVLSRLQRSFTITECDNYRIDPCPTLEELREG